MRHDLSRRGHRFGLRPVTTDDAAFILSLRSDPELGRYLHETSPRLEDQVAWIEAYQRTAGDFYFIVEDQREHKPVGTIGIYDVTDDGRTAEWGRWIIHPSSAAAVESALLIYCLAFEDLALKSVYCRTVKDNAQVVSFHDSSGAERAGLLTDHVMLGGRAYDSIEHRVDQARWATMRPRLDMLAQRLGRM